MGNIINSNPHITFVNIFFLIGELQKDMIIVISRNKKLPSLFFLDLGFQMSVVSFTN